MLSQHTTRTPKTAGVSWGAAWDMVLRLLVVFRSEEETVPTILRYLKPENS